MTVIGHSPIALPNRLGWVTQLSVEHKRDFVDVTAYGDKDRMIIPAQRSLEVDLHIVSNGNPSILMNLFEDWMSGGLKGPTLQKEYMCLYCAVPNSIELSSCRKCGAPRSFVIG